LVATADPELIEVWRTGRPSGPRHRRDHRQAAPAVPISRRRSRKPRLTAKLLLHQRFR
jgi:hypothetical protein